MKTLIVYASKHGCTETCAEKLKSGLPGGADLIHLKQKLDMNLESYDTVLIGGSIHAGKIQSSVKKFCADYESALLQKKIGLFLCCMEEGETAKTQFEAAFPAGLKDHAAAKGLFGGAFNFEKMNWLERIITKKIAKTDQSVSRINEDEISRFTTDLKR
jgi:menaquinone-dependent protoporphyrinogen oxidase